MSVSTKKEKVQFWRKWTLINALVLIVSYVVSGFVLLFIAGSIFDNSIDEWGSPFEQTVGQIAMGIIIGFSIGITQWRLLRKLFNVSSFWLYSIVLGFIIVELIAGIILWKLDINRGELSFIEFNALAHALLLTITGFIIGIIQMPLLKKHYAGSAYWVMASTAAWGMSIFITAIDQNSELALLITFMIGAILYGAITGATLMWILKPKK